MQSMKLCNMYGLLLTLGERAAKKLQQRSSSNADSHAGLALLREYLALLVTSSSSTT